ncbi:hypothetical protein SMD22_22255 [Brevibacillus halotolerans]|nr:MULTISPECIES: hypothetical protein [Brevibacillus]MCR8996456.1 hypothetical protein [Brevibacillus laterosporus]WPS87177.1 hypothetical protein SMD22_22255 [Brevibacillus halotolerans]
MVRLLDVITNRLLCGLLINIHSRVNFLDDLRFELVAKKGLPAL